MSTAAARPVACVDLGTNTCHLLVAVAQHGTRRVLVDTCRMVRLGQGVDETRLLRGDAMERTLQCLTEYATVARSLGAQRLHLVATSAMRDALNGPAFAARITAVTGFDARIIDGEEEARLSWLSAARDFGAPGRTLLAFDVGGGSTEFMLGEGDTLAQRVSLNVGSVRLTERFLHHDPPTSDEVERVRAVLAQELAAMPNAANAVVVGLAGTVTTLCCAALGMAQHDARAVHGRVLSRGNVDALVVRLAQLPAARRLEIPAVERGRQDVILAGALLVQAVLQASGKAELLVGDGGVRWGLLETLVTSHGG